MGYSVFPNELAWKKKQFVADTTNYNQVKS